MGVHSLTGYIERYALTKPLPIHPDTPINVVIDGSSLVHHLYFLHLDWILGSQYTQLLHFVDTFMAQLAANHMIVKSVVFDGGRASTAKQNVRIERDTGRAKSAHLAMKSIAKSPLIFLNDAGLPILDDAGHSRRNHRTFNLTQPVLPILASFTVMHHLRTQYQFSVMAVHGEADRVVAQLANFHNAYVIANDSDYYVYPLTLGYIRLESIYNHVDSTINFTNVNVYHQDLLAKSIDFLDPHWFPVLACCLGNDYVDVDELGDPIIQLWHCGSAVKLKLATLRTKSIATFIRDRVTQAHLSPATHAPEAVVPYILQYLLTNLPALSTTTKFNTINFNKLTLVNEISHQLNTTGSSKKNSRHNMIIANKAANAKQAINPLRKQVRKLTLDDLESSSEESSSSDSVDSGTDSSTPGRAAVSSETVIPSAKTVNWRKADPNDLELWALHPKFQLIKTGIDEYVLKDYQEAQFQSTAASKCALPRPSLNEIRDLIQRGVIPSAIVDVLYHETLICKPLLEDVSRSSCWIPSMQVRMRAYALLPSPTNDRIHWITETGRFTPRSIALNEYTYRIQDQCTQSYLCKPICVMESELDVIVTALSLIVHHWDPEYKCDVAPSLDLVLSSLMSIVQPVHPSELSQLRITSRVHHWCSAFDCMLFSMMLDFHLIRLGVCDRIPKFDHPSVHYYYGRISPEFRDLECINFSVLDVVKDRIRVVFPEYVDEIDVVVKSLMAVLEYSNCRVPARSSCDWDPDEARRSENGQQSV